MIKLSLELTRSEANGPTYRPYTDLVDKVSSESFEAVKAKVEVEGWLIHPWLVSDQHPYDEGYAVAAGGNHSDTNPYAEHFWKHNEWWQGWEPPEIRKLKKNHETMAALFFLTGGDEQQKSVTGIERRAKSVKTDRADRLF